MLLRSDGHPDLISYTEEGIMDNQGLHGSLPATR